jgi:hypothetical protein
MVMDNILPVFESWTWSPPTEPGYSLTHSRKPLASSEATLPGVFWCKATNASSARLDEYAYLGSVEGVS